MITNESQFRATRAHLDRDTQAAANIEARPGKPTKLQQLELDAVRAQPDDLRAELDGFDQLGVGGGSSFAVESLEEFSTLLVRAHLARG